MSLSQNVQENQKLIKLVNQVKALSKIVDELQDEVKAIKLNTRTNMGKQQPTNSKQPEVKDSKSKLNPFQRLRFFKKDNKTNAKSSTSTDSNPKVNKDRKKKVKTDSDQSLKNNRPGHYRSNAIPKADSNDVNFSDKVICF